MDGDGLIFYRVVQYRSGFYKAQRLREPHNGKMKNKDFYTFNTAYRVARHYDEMELIHIRECIIKLRHREIMFWDRIEKYKEQVERELKPNESMPNMPSQ